MKTKWAIVIFSSRETLDVLAQTIVAARVAAQDMAHIEVVVNGNPSLAGRVAAWVRSLPARGGETKVNVWSVALCDKANAWNQYTHHIWAGEEIAFFIDGYVRLNPDAVSLLGNAVVSDPTVLGGTGIPTVGRTAGALRQQLLTVGGFHGNFCCIKGNAINQMHQRNIALPVGLYRVDSLMSALLSFGLHPEKYPWNPKLILVHPGASWQIDVKRWWRLSEIKAKMKQILRQARGKLENRAVTDHFVARVQLAESLPNTAQELVLHWLDICCTEEVKNSIMRHPISRHAVSEIRAAQIPDESLFRAHLIISN